MAISKRLRYEVLRRDNHQCRYCGASAPGTTLTVDHVVPTTLGGTDDPSNLVACCGPCNSGKSASSPDAPIIEDVAQDAVRWSRAMKAAIQSREDGRREMETLVEDLCATWDEFRYGPDHEYEVPHDDEWGLTFETFLRSGLTLRFIDKAIRTAMSNRKLRADNVWRYMCGICWRELDRCRELASQAIEQEEQAELKRRCTEPSPLAQMRETAPPADSLFLQYGNAVATLFHPRTTFWASYPGGVVHRSWSQCFTKDSVTFEAFRTSPFHVPFGLTIDEVQRLCGDGDGWSDVLCEACCGSLRELLAAGDVDA